MVLKAKNKLVARSIEIKQEVKNVMFWLKKDVSKVNIASMNFAEHLRKFQMFQRKAKLIMADFYEMNFMKDIVILVKVDEMYNILKPASHCFLIKRWNSGLVSSGISLTSWGEGASLVLVGHPLSDGVTIKLPYGVDVLLYRPASHPIFSY